MEWRIVNDNDDDNWNRDGCESQLVTTNLNNQVGQCRVPGKGDQEGEREYFFPSAPLQRECKIGKKEKMIALAAGPCWGWDGCN